MNTPHLEIGLQRDMDRIRASVEEMMALGEQALKQCLDALVRKDRQLAYAVILRDLFIDAHEKEIDRLCLEFLVRQQPVGEPLRFAFGAIKLSIELERVGDYAESIARQIVKLVSLGVDYPSEPFVEIAGVAIPMLRDSIDAFMRHDVALARNVIAREESVDLLKRQINAHLAELFQQKKLPLEALNALTTVARRFERVSDQARNVSMEALYVATGQFAKHPDADMFRMLFVDEKGTGAATLAEALGTSLKQPKFTFASASLNPQPLSHPVAELLGTMGVDASRMVPRALNQVSGLDHFHVVVFLDKASRQAFPQQTSKGVFLDWFVEDIARLDGTPEHDRAALAAIRHFLAGHIRDLVDVVLGKNQLKLEGV